MKKIIAIVLALILCLSLFACNTPPEPSGTGETGIPTEPGFVEVPKPDTLPTSGWATRSRMSTEVFAIMESGCFYLLNQCLYYLDTATGYSVGLCSKPGCLHGEETDNKKRNECDAFISGLVSMMFYHDGSLYYAIFEETGYELYARSQDGTDLRKIGVLGSQYASENTSAQIGDWVFAYGKLYYKIIVEEAVVGEDGSFTYSNPTDVLVQLDLSSGKETELLRSADETITLRGANEDMALFWMVHRATMEDMERPDYQDYIKQFPAYLRLWHKEGNGVSTLCEMDRTATNTMVGFANGKHHMFGSGSDVLYAYDFASMSFGKSDLPEDLSIIWSEKYGGVLDWSGYYDLETGAYYTSEYNMLQIPAGITSFSASSRAFGEQGMIVVEMYIKENVVVYSDYAYIPFEKMNDGLQLSDRILFVRDDGSKDHLIQPEN